MIPSSSRASAQTVYDRHYGSERAGGYVRRSGAAADDATSGPLGKLTVGAFYLFVVAYFFEAVDFGLPVHHTTLLGGLLVLLATLRPRACFGRVPVALWWFASYLVCFLFFGLLSSGNDPGEFLQRLFVLAQLLLLFWVSFNLTRNESVALGFVAALALGSLAAAATQLLGITSAPVDEASGRLTILDADPNSVAVTLSLGLLCLVTLLFGQPNVAPRIKFALLMSPLMVAVVAAIVQTGSRGGFIALAAGFLILAFPSGPRYYRVRNGILVLAGLVSLAVYATQSDVFSRRFERSVDSGALSGRDQIYPAAWQMFLEKPLFGWGPVANTLELGRRLHVSGREQSQFGGHINMQTHNQVLYVLTATGVVGAVLFLAGTWLCLHAAWRARTGIFGSLPLSLVTAVLVAAMSVDAIYWKHHWLILAFGLASGSPRRASIPAVEPQAVSPTAEVRFRRRTRWT